MQIEYGLTAFSCAAPTSPEARGRFTDPMPPGSDGSEKRCPPRMWVRAARAATLASTLAAPAAIGATVDIPASKDNSLYETIDGTVSNGAGQHIFTGRTAIATLRRALIAFDVAGSVPAGSTITRATLTLHMSITISFDQPVSLHRAISDWGAAASDAPGQEGTGAPAETGDATWLHRFYNTVFWTTAGSDFEASPSAAILVDQNGFYEWTSGAMALDVQQWLDAPASNFGWVVVGNELEDATAKRFDSSENPTTSVRPVLQVEYAAAGTPAGSVPDGDQTPGTPLTLQPIGGGTLGLAWGASCGAANDYEVYEGALGTFGSYAPLLCTTSGSTNAVITTSSGGRFYLVVPRNGTNEGSYGKDGTGTERPPSAFPCLPQTLGGCP